MTDKEKFRKEVEKLKSNLVYGACASQVAMENRCKEEAYNEVLAILDTMQEEPVSEQKLSNVQRYVKNWNEPVSEELEKAAEGYAITDEVLPNGKVMINFQVEKAFRAGAKWQKEHLMKDAVDVTVHIDSGGYPYIPQMELYDYDKDIPLAKEGDKYKVVLIKEE